ncbi:chloroplast lumenal protein, partial [Haematococcus lacustris]
MRDRILADNMFLFKVGAEVVIDSGCATVAEVRKRGKDFWAEFDFYLSDLVVGLVLDVALVSLMAPAAVLGGASRAAMTTGWLQRALASVPSAVFEANIRGVKSFSLGSRVACLGVKFLEYSLAGISCGLVLDVALVSLMAPAAVLGGASKAAMTTGWLQRALASVPSAVFEANIRGVKSFSLGSRVACLGVKFLEYSLAGISCGLVGQGVCNAIMHLKRSIHGTKEDDVAVPPLMKTALVWGLFMGLSSNIRYQVVYGLERVVDLTVAKHVPAVAYGSTLAIRFVNNVIG